MKKLLFIIILFLYAFAANAQKESAKKDTLVSIQFTLVQYRSVLYTIDSNIDSKKVSKELLEFIQKHTRLVEDKPKDTIKK